MFPRLPLIGILLFIALWQAVVSLTGLPRFILPGPLLVIEAMWTNRELILEHALVTLAEVLIGMAIGALLGGLSAVYLAYSPAASRLLRPILVFSQAIPVFALAPILTLWLGYGLLSKVAMAVLIIYFPVTSSFYDGLVQTPRGYLDLACTMGADRGRRLLLVQVPSAMPSLASGLRLGAVYAPIGAVIGEWVGASRGLGYLMLLANGRAKIDLMFAALVVLGIMAVILYAAVDRLGQRMRHGY